MTKEITDKDFEEEVINSELPVLVDFWAEWCGPCKMLGPIVDQISTEHAAKLKTVKLDISDNPESPSKYAVRSIPTMILFKNGEPVATKIGLHQKNALEEWINSNI